MNNKDSMYRREQCKLCSQLGVIVVCKNARLKKTHGHKEVCPMCKGKGYLKIYKEDLEQ